jgi:hypothetical protein
MTTFEKYSFKELFKNIPGGQGGGANFIGGSYQKLIIFCEL